MFEVEAQQAQGVSAYAFVRWDRMDRSALEEEQFSKSKFCKPDPDVNSLLEPCLMMPPHVQSWERYCSQAAGLR